MSEERPGLKRLLHPFSDRRFIDEYWPTKPLVLHHGEEALAELTKMPELQSAESIFRRCSGPAITAMMPDKKDESNSIQVTPDVAIKLYEAGLNMSVGGAEKWFPPLRDWVENLLKDLGMPRTTWGRCIIYTSPPKTGAPMHFDMNANFSLQLKGRKKWTLAPNDNVTYPTERHVMQLDATPGLLAQSHDPNYPKELKETETIELVPGSLLFIPRAYWHATAGDEETIALNFTFSQQSWAVIFALALVERLHKREMWRKTPILRAPSAAELTRHREEAKALLDDAKSQIDEMSAAELLGIASVYTHTYRRKEGLVLRVEGDAVALAIEGKGTMPIETPPEYIPIFRYVFGSPSSSGRPWFKVEDVLEHNDGGVGQTDIYILLQRLAQAEVLEAKDEG